MSRPAGFYGDWSLSFRDAGNEIGVVRGCGIAIDGDNDGSNVGTQQGLFTAFYTKVAALVLGAPVKREYYYTQDVANALPTNGSTRELKLLTIYQCTATGKRYTLAIPTLSPTVPLYINNVSVKDAVRTDSPTAITEYITAFNNFVIAPDHPSDGDGVYAVAPACTVIGLRVVGRNN